MTVEEHYRRFYFEALDLAINSIKQRFDQPGVYNVRINILRICNCRVQMEKFVKKL